MSRRATLPGARRSAARRYGSSGAPSASASQDHAGLVHYGTPGVTTPGPNLELAAAWGGHGRALFNFNWALWPYGTGVMVAVPQLFGVGGTLRKLQTCIYRNNPGAEFTISIFDNLGPSKLWPRNRLWQASHAPVAGPTPYPYPYIQTFAPELSVRGGTLLWLGYQWNGSGDIYFPRMSWWESGYPGILGGNRSDLVLATSDPGQDNWTPMAWIVSGVSYPAPSSVGTAGAARVRMMDQPVTAYTFERT
jgi:hypothetical protein